MFRGDFFVVLFKNKSNHYAMFQNKERGFSLLVIISLIALAAIGGVVYYRSRSKPTAQAPQSGAPQAQTGGEAAGQQTIEITASGFSPATVSVKKGTTVIFVNRDTTPHWPASGMHPTHQLCPGFDALRGLQTGESYRFTFNDVKECPFHDHLNVSLRGKVTVTE
jgi:plastocyanin